MLNPESINIGPIPSSLVMNRTLKVPPTNSVIASSVLPMMKPPVLKVNIPKPIRYIGPKFRVKLSYPNTQNIVLATADGKIGKIMLDKKRIPMQVSQKISIEIVPNNKISLKI